MARVGTIRAVTRVGALIAAGLACLAACSDADPVEPTSQAKAVDIANALKVSEQVVPDYKAVAAIVTNRDAGDGRARIGGKLTRLLVREGDAVRRNQLVAVVSDDRIALEARAAAASEAAARAAAEQAARDLSRAEKLFATQAVSQAAVEAARAQAQTTASSLRAAKAQAEAARALRLQGEVRAPADGRVTRASIPEGSAVMAGDLVVGISTGAQVLRIELPEAEAGVLAPGGDITLVAEDGSPPQIAKVRQVYPAVSNGRITADLDAPGLGAGFIGARVRVLVPVGERPAIIIPSRYIETRYGADYVRLSRSGGVIDAPIQRGPATPTQAMPDGVEVLSGLRPGDLILPAAEQAK